MKTDNTEGVERLRIGNGRTIWKDENGNVTMIHQEPVIKVTNSGGGHMGRTPPTAGLENIKPGDWVKMQVTEIDEEGKYPIRISTGNTSTLSFTKNGENYKGGMQIIFPLEEHEQPFKERWMMVSDDEGHWEKRKVFAHKNNKYIAWNGAKNDEQVKDTYEVTAWKYAKEIEEEQPKKLSLEERVKILEEKLSKI
jgi:hypothetical protein